MTTAAYGTVDWLRRAYRHASAESDDRKTQNGAVIVVPDGQFVVAANKLALALPEYPDDATKAKYMDHAEVAAAARHGLCTRGATMYCPWAACMSCARIIAAAGISRLVVHERMMQRTYPKYVAEIEEALALLAARGVTVVRFDEEVGECQNLMNHERWNP